MSATTQAVAVAQSLATLKYYLNQQGIHNITSLVGRLQDSKHVLESSVDWRQVHFLTSHIPTGSVKFKAAVEGLSRRDPNQCKLLVGIVSNLDELQTVLAFHHNRSTPLLVVGFSASYVTLKEIHEHLKGEDGSLHSIRYDFLDPKWARLVNANPEQQMPDSLVNMLHTVVQEGAASFDVLFDSLKQVTEADVEKAMNQLEGLDLAGILATASAPSAESESETDTDVEEQKYNARPDQELQTSMDPYY